MHLSISLNLMKKLHLSTIKQHPSISWHLLMSPHPRTSAHQLLMTLHLFFTKPQRWHPFSRLIHHIHLFMSNQQLLLLCSSNKHKPLSLFTRQHLSTHQNLISRLLFTSILPLQATVLSLSYSYSDFMWSLIGVRPIEASYAVIVFQKMSKCATAISKTKVPGFGNHYQLKREER